MALRQWQETSPVVAFRTFLMGTSEHTTSRVRKLHGAEMALKTIASQVGALPHWDELARRVENARSRCFGKTLEIPLGAHSFPETSVMVEEYKRFLRIKHKAKDYASTDLSPPMEEDNITGVKLLDEIWHIHIAMRTMMTVVLSRADTSCSTSPLLPMRHTCDIKGCGNFFSRKRNSSLS